MTSKPTLFIGIPAYNEERNIGFLLDALLKQKCENFDLTEILVISDGSSDNTAGIAKGFNNQVIKVKDDKVRKGVAARQNEIFNSTDADILVMLNADIGFENDYFLQELAKAIENGADMVAARMSTMKPVSFVESVLSKSEEMKRAMFEKFNNADNVYTCHGAARAFSKKFYQNFVFKTAVGEDAFSYFYSKQNSLNYVYSKEAVFFIRAAGTPKDYFKQSTRHANTLKRLKLEFKEIDITKEYRIPLGIKLEVLCEYFFKSPVKITAFVFLFCTSFVKSFFTRSSEMWDLSTSTKVLYENKQN